MPEAAALVPWDLTALGACAGCIVGGFAAYKDVDAFFRERRVGLTPILTHVPSILFLLLNGVAAAGLIVWALRTQDTSPINKLLTTDSPWLKVLAISLGVPVLLKSRFYNDKDNNPVGLDTLYEWVRRACLRSLNAHAAQVKSAIANTYAGNFSGDADFAEAIEDYVIQLVRPFVTDEEIATIRREFEEYRLRFADDPNSRRHHERLILLALDTAGIRPIRRWLEQRAKA